MQINNKFSTLTSAQVKKICQPFLTAHQFTSFNYARIYPDKSLLVLHSDPLFSSLYLELNCPPMPPIPDAYWQYSQFYFLAITTDDEPYNDLLNSSRLQTNSDNPLFIINRQGSYLEVAVFGGAWGDMEVLNRYVNNIISINNFVRYFTEKTECLFREAKNDRLFLPEHLLPKIPFCTVFNDKNSIYERFYRDLVLQQLFPRCLLEKLTTRELQCLYHLSRGYRYKAIANELAISPRTVESHLINAKNKLNIVITSQLISLLKKVL